MSPVSEMGHNQSERTGNGWYYTRNESVFVDWSTGTSVGRVVRVLLLIRDAWSSRGVKRGRELLAAGLCQGYKRIQTPTAPQA